MKVKSDKEFVAECEVVVRNGGKFSTYEGVPVLLSGGTIEMLTEAIERLKRHVDPVSQVTADPKFALTSSPVDAVQIAALAAKDKEIAELKRLLRWCVTEMKKDYGSANVDEWSDDEWLRANEILKQSESNGG